MDQSSPQPKRRGGTTFGFMLVLLGVVLLLRNTGLMPWPDRGGSWLPFWSIVFLSLGLSRFFTPRPDGRREGVGLLFVGAWLLLNQLQVLIYRDSWPILLVGIGLSIVWGALAGRPAKPE